MKESVWYSAAHDEIWIRHGRNRIERGVQGTVESRGTRVPDYLSLFLWKVELKKWKDHLEQGWLIRLS